MAVSLLDVNTFVPAISIATLVLVAHSGMASAIVVLRVFVSIRTTFNVAHMQPCPTLFEYPLAAHRQQVRVLGSDFVSNKYVLATTAVVVLLLHSMVT